MPVSVGWLLKNHIVDYKMIGIVSSENMIAHSEQVVQLISANPRNTVHVLYDVRQCKKIPYDIPNILKALKPFLLLPNMGWGIAYGSQDPVTRFTADIIVQLTKVRYRDFKTQQEALAFVAQMDTALPLAEGFKQLQNEGTA